MENAGMGVMLGMLGGNEETVNAVQSSLNKIIDHVLLDDDRNELRFQFTDGTMLRVFDGGQSCCESRYMNTSDDLSEYAGAKLESIELRDGPTENGKYGDEHQSQFLDVHTSIGMFQCTNHNEHNGYYGGFCIVARTS